MFPIISLILFISLSSFSKQYDYEKYPLKYQSIDDEGPLSFKLDDKNIIFFYHDKQVIFNIDIYNFTSEKDINERIDEEISGRHSMRYSPDLKSVVYVCNKSVLIVINIKEESRQFIHLKFRTFFNLDPYLQPKKFYGWEDFELLSGFYSPESNELLYFFLYSPNKHKFVTFFYNISTHTYEKSEIETRTFSGWRMYLKCTNKWKQYDNNSKYVLCFTMQEDDVNHINHLMVGVVITSGIKNVNFIDFEPFYSFPDTDFTIKHFHILDHLERYDTLIYVHKKHKSPVENFLDVLVYKKSILQNKIINKEPYKKIEITEPTFEHLAMAIEFNNEFLLCYGLKYRDSASVHTKCLRMDNSENEILSFKILDESNQMYQLDLYNFNDKQLVIITAGRRTIEFNIITVPLKLSSNTQSFSVNINKNVLLN